MYLISIILTSKRMESAKHIWSPSTYILILVKTWNFKYVCNQTTKSNKTKNIPSRIRMNYQGINWNDRIIVIIKNIKNVVIIFEKVNETYLVLPI